MRFFLLLIGVLVFLLNPNSLAFAKTIEISPAYVEISLSEKENEHSFDLFIKNKTEKTIKVDLSSLDFKQNDPFGAIGFLGKEIGNYTYSLSSFLSYDRESLDILPGKSEKVVVTVRDRQDLSPGGHYAAVIVRQTPVINNKDAVISPALSSLIYLNKEGGERYNLSFKDINFPRLPVVFSYPPTYVITFQNDGNTHLTPYGRSDIKDIFGRLIYKGVINEGSLRVLPQSRRYIPVYSRKVAISLPISINKITVEGKDSLGKTKFGYEEIFFYINPFFLGVFILGILLLFYFKLKKLKLFKNKNSKKDA